MIKAMAQTYQNDEQYLALSEEQYKIKEEKLI